jgi:hypothetical protein
MGNPAGSPDGAPKNFWQVLKIKSALRDEDFGILKTTEKCDYCTGSCSTTGVSKMFPTVAASLS